MSHYEEIDPDVFAAWREELGTMNVRTPKMMPEELQEFKETVEAMHPDEPEVQAFTTTKEEDIAVI